MFNLVHFQILHTSWSVPPQLKYTTNFLSSEVIQNVYLNKVKAICCVHGYLIYPTCKWISCFLMDPIYIWNKDEKNFYGQNVYTQRAELGILYGTVSAVLHFNLTVSHTAEKAHSKKWPPNSSHG